MFFVFLFHNTVHVIANEASMVATGTNNHIKYMYTLTLTSFYSFFVTKFIIMMYMYVFSQNATVPQGLTAE